MFHIVPIRRKVWIPRSIKTESVIETPLHYNLLHSMVTWMTTPDDDDDDDDDGNNTGNTREILSPADAAKS